MSTLTVGQMHDILVFFNHDFPGKQVRSIRVKDSNTVSVTYLDDEGKLSFANYRFEFEFTARLV